MEREDVLSRGGGGRKRGASPPPPVCVPRDPPRGFFHHPRSHVDAHPRDIIPVPVPIPVPDPDRAASASASVPAARRSPVNRNGSGGSFVLFGKSGARDHSGSYLCASVAGASDSRMAAASATGVEDRRIASSRPSRNDASTTGASGPDVANAAARAGRR